jgi:predicted signal transduction protein with EAL and GGDEF domain
VIEANGKSRKVGCSIGVAVSAPDDRTVEPVIERADEALYVAKANGRGQVRWFGADGIPRPARDASGHFVGVNGN